MNQDLKRTKIAEACGWKWYVHVESSATESAHPGCRFLDLPGKWMDFIFVREAQMNEPIAETGSLPPDYFNDLNACHEMEKEMTDNQWEEYTIRLTGEEMGEEWPTCFLNLSAVANAIHATAAQRAEAFGKTLNLW